MKDRKNTIQHRIALAAAFVLVVIGLLYFLVPHDHKEGIADLFHNAQYLGDSVILMVLVTLE